MPGRSLIRVGSASLPLRLDGLYRVRRDGRRVEQTPPRGASPAERGTAFLARIYCAAYRPLKIVWAGARELSDAHEPACSVTQGAESGASCQQQAQEKSPAKWNLTGP